MSSRGLNFASLAKTKQNPHLSSLIVAVLFFLFIDMKYYDFGIDL